MLDWGYNGFTHRRTRVPSSTSLRQTRVVRSNSTLLCNLALCLAKETTISGCWLAFGLFETLPVQPNKSYGYYSILQVALNFMVFSIRLF